MAALNLFVDHWHMLLLAQTASVPLASRPCRPCPGLACLAESPVARPAQDAQHHAYQTRQVIPSVPSTVHSSRQLLQPFWCCVASVTWPHSTWPWDHELGQACQELLWGAACVQTLGGRSAAQDCPQHSCEGFPSLQVTSDTPPDNEDQAAEEVVEGGFKFTRAIVTPTEPVIRATGYSELGGVQVCCWLQLIKPLYEPYK